MDKQYVLNYGRLIEDVKGKYGEDPDFVALFEALCDEVQRSE
jgi:hypothetical protein